MKVRKAVGAVVFQNNEYLLIHKVKNSDNKSIDGYWDFPKGGVEKLDEEIEYVKFFGKEELRNALSHEETREFLDEVFNEI